MSKHTKMLPLFVFVLTIIGARLSEAAAPRKSMTCGGSVCVYADQCAVDPVDRYDCGFPGVGEQGCLDRGCCFNNSVSDTLWCFFADIAPCDIPETNRYDCGYPGITTEECLDKGCCHDSGHGTIDVPHCYHKKSSPYFEVTTRSDGLTQFWQMTHQKSFSFTVRACHSAIVYLGPLVTISVEDQDCYRITLGDNSNSEVSIHKKIAGQVIEQYSQPDSEPLSCDQARSFWITWYDYQFKVGTSVDNILLSWTDHSDTLITVNAVGLYTEGLEGEWTLSKDMGSTMVLYAPRQTPLNYDEFSMEVTAGQTGMIIAVHVPDSAYILLAESGGGHTDWAYEIIIGDEQNTETTIRRYNSEQSITMDTPGIILDNKYYTDFWVSWKDGHIQLGSGHILGKKKIIDFIDGTDEHRPVRFISVASVGNTDERSAWYLDEAREEQYTLVTPATHHPNVTAHMNTQKTHFIFEVRACADAHILFATREAYYHYEVELGRSNNTISVVRTYELGSNNPVDHLSRSTPGILNCVESRQFWISWEGSQIVVGYGHELYKHELMRTHDLSLSDAVTGIGLRSGGGFQAEWMFPKHEVTKVVIDLPNRPGYERLWYTMVDDESVQFRAKACQDIYIALSSMPGSAVYRAYEIMIGGESNTVSEIRVGQGGPAVTSYSGAVLHCDTWDFFWASWDVDEIRFGKGTVVGQDVIMSAQRDPQWIFPISSLGVSTTEKNTNQAQFEMDHLTYNGQTYQIFSQRGDDEKRSRLVTNKDHLYFNVKACSEAHIIIASDPDHTSDNSYTISIGEQQNTRVSIYKGGSSNPVKSEAVTDILNCQESHTFHASWSGDEVSLGWSTDIGENIIIEYDDNEKYQSLQFVFLVSDESQGAEWLIRQDAGSTLLFTTTTLYGYNTVWMTQYDRTSFVFKVKAQNDAHISLSSVETTPGIHPAYEIVLGASANTRSMIRDERLNNDKVSVNTPDILSEEDYRYFWISWLSSKIEVGRGNVVGQDQFMSWQDPDYSYTVSKTAVSTGWDSTGDWGFSVYEDDFYVVKTRGEATYDYSNLRIIPPSTFEFEVMACDDATMGFLGDLVTDDEQLRQLSYEIVIGARSNTKTYIRRSDQSSWPAEQETDSPGILKCQEYVRFAIDQGSGSFLVYELDGSFSFSWTDPDPLFVSYISLTSSLQGASYKVPRSMGLFTEVTINPVMPTKHRNRDGEEFMYEQFWGSLHGKNYITMNLRAKEEAYLLLAEYLHVKTHLAYEIRFGELQGNWIRAYHPNGDLCDEFYESGLLDENTFKPFWVSWDDGRIRVGHGITKGERTLITCTPTSAMAVSALSMDSGSQSLTTWQISAAKGESYGFWTDSRDLSDWYLERCLLAPRQDFITFEVAASEWVAISLQSGMFKTAERLYEVHLGVKDGVRQKSYIFDVQGNQKYDEQDTPDLLRSGAVSSFWISWYDGMLTVGTGHSKGGPVLLKLPHTMSGQINGIVFASPTSKIYWQIPRSYARRITCDDPDERERTRVDVTLFEERLMFQVTASKLVTISLSPLTVSTHHYDVYIGNINTSLLQATGISQAHEVLLQVETKNILSSFHHHCFWLTWHDRVIRLGTGGEFYEAQVFSYDNIVDLRYRAVIVEAGPTDSAVWEMGETQGNVNSRVTSDVFDYHTFWMRTTKTSLVFQVRCSNDAHVLMSTTMHQNDSSHAYEIVFGGGYNARMFIRKGSSWNGIPAYENSAEFPGLVHSDEMRTFWVSWEGGLLQAGSGGTPLAHTMLVWQDPDPLDVQYLALSTGWGSTGEWDISHDQGDTLNLNTRGDGSHDYNDVAVTTEGFNYVVFEVKACSGAKIALSWVPLRVDAGTFEIVIGTNGNKGISLKETIDGEDVCTEALDLELLDCDSMKTFYIWWNWWDAIITVEVGQGSELGSGMLMYCKPNLDHTANSISFKTDAGIDGEWRIISTGSTHNIVDGGEEEEDGGGGGLSLGGIMGIVMCCIIVAFLLAVIVVLMIPKYQRRLWDRYGRFENEQSPPNITMDPLDSMHDTSGGTSSAVSDPQGSGTMTMDPTMPGEDA